VEALQPDDQKLTMAAKTFDYIVVLKQRDFKLVDNISIMMLLLAIIVLLEKALTPFSNASVFPLAVATLISGWIIFTFIKKRNGKTGYYRIGLLFAAWGLFVTLKMPYTLITAIYVIAAVMEKQVKFVREVAFDTTEVVFNTFPRRHFQWNELSNIILKDGLLTIDFKNNKLIQSEIDAQTTPELEKDFNEFCRSMITTEGKNSSSAT
jgi:hypothetical protein